jgi:hypothetical protein
MSQPRSIFVLFRGDMVEAILSDLKHQTRRLEFNGTVGDRILVKETFYAWGYWVWRLATKSSKWGWQFVDLTTKTDRTYQYSNSPPPTILDSPKRDQSLGEVEVKLPAGWHKRNSLFMPREAVRITLEVTGVRRERLQQISRDDAIDEGIKCAKYGRWFCYLGGAPYSNAILSFRSLWDSIHGGSEADWKADPEVSVINFKRVV